MAFSYVDLVASAGQQNFPFAISYLNRDNMSVFINGVVLDTADWSFLLAQTIRLDVGADLDDIVRIKRVTPIDEPIVDYSNGSVLGEAELDATALQTLFAAQEVADSQADNIHMNDSLQWDALGFPIINLGAPVESDDAARLEEFETIGAEAAASAAEAAASASAASTSATQALASRNAALLAEANAETAEANAEAAETAAELAETNAAASAAKLQGTSTTSLLIATGSKVFTTQSGKFFDAGYWLLATSNANPANYMHGQVTTYSGTTLTLNVTNIGGSGTLSDWTIRVAGTRGAVGATGAAGGVSSPSATVAAETAFGVASSAGASSDYSRGDHTHGTPANPVPAHEAAGDPHTGYQKESEKDAASGYAGLTAGSKIQDNAVVTLSITDAAVTKAKMENADADSLLGRGNGGGAGVPQKITLGTNLSMSGTTLNAAGGGGGDSLIYEFW